MYMLVSCRVIGTDEETTFPPRLPREDEKGGSSATSSARLTQCSTEASRSYSPERQRLSGPHEPLPFANLQVGRYKLCLRRTDHGKFEHDVFDSSVRISLDLLVQRGIANLWLSLQWSAIAARRGVWPRTGIGAAYGLGAVSGPPGRGPQRACPHAFESAERKLSNSKP